MNFVQSLESLIYFLHVIVQCELDPEQSSCESNSVYSPEEDALGSNSEEYTHGPRNEFDGKPNSSLPMKLKMDISAFEKTKNYDIVKVRKQKRSVYQALTVACQDLKTREDFVNSFNTKIFTEKEFDGRLRREPAISCYLENIPVAELKYLILGVRINSNSVLQMVRAQDGDFEQMKKSSC